MEAMGLAPTSRCLQGSIAPVAHALPSLKEKWQAARESNPLKARGLESRRDTHSPAACIQTLLSTASGDRPSQRNPKGRGSTHDFHLHYPGFGIMAARLEGTLAARIFLIWFWVAGDRESNRSLSHCQSKVNHQRKDEHRYRSFAPVAAGFHWRNVSVFSGHTSLTIEASQVAKS